MHCQWGDLTPRRFEELARDFLQDQYPSGNWILLPQSGDGNRDVENEHGLPIFNEDLAFLEWAEAKHTSQISRPLQKGQLDPTIVSALIDTRVVALMFISNGLYPKTYIPRAERALSSLRAGPYFIDGPQLERWLNERPKLFNTYFAGAKRQSSEDANSFEVVDVRTVSIVDYGDGHFEPRIHLKRAERVVLVIIVRASAPMQVGLTLEASGLEIRHNSKFPTTLLLRGGLQSIPLVTEAVREHAQCWGTVSLRDDSGNSQAGRFRYAIGPESVEVICASQIAAQQKLYQTLNSHIQLPRSGCLRLIGPAASGKSWLQQKFMEEHALSAQVRRLVFGATPGENAQTICRCLLFLSFGIGADFSSFEDIAQPPTDDLPFTTIKSLQQGANAPDQAAEVLERLIASNQLAVMFTRMNRGDPKVLLLDDLHKADELSLRVLRYTLSRLEDGENDTLLVLAHRPEFVSLNDNIRPLLRRDIQLKSITRDDISSALQLVLPLDVASVVQEKASEVIRNVLELSTLIGELRSWKVEETGSIPDQIAYARRALIETSVGHIATQLSGKSEEIAADLLAIIEGGVEESFLRERFGERVVDSLLNSDLFHITPTVAPVARVVLAHDLLREAYLSRREVYSEELAEHIGALLEALPHRRPDLLPHLCRCGSSWRRRYLAETLIVRDKLLKQTRFGTARGMSEILYDLLQRMGRRTLGLTEDQHLTVLFGHADCVNHTEGAALAWPHFEETLDIAHRYPRSMSTVGYACRAAAEIFNVRFWQLDTASLPDDIESFLIEYKGLAAHLRSENWVDGTMTSINRLMMVFYLMDESNKGHLAFNQGMSFAKQFGKAHDRANLFMDEAKCLFWAKPEFALNHMERALKMYESTSTQVRRLMVCRTQLKFLRARLKLTDISDVEEEAKGLVEASFMQEYANAGLQAAALFLIEGSISVAKARLQQVAIQKNALSQSPRREMLWHNLAGVAQALDGNPELAREHFKNHERLADNLGASYREIASHNLLRLTADSAVWAGGEETQANAMRLEPRLW